MHLVPEFGFTYREIEADGFRIDAKIDMLLAGDTAAAAAKSMGVGVVGFVDAFQRLSPDLVMLLGDRFEALAAAGTALVMGIPIAHISGGDVTEGAFDDGIRHAITKMAHLHFTASAQSAARVRQMGEDPARVFAVGDPGLDSLRTMKLLTRAALERDLGFNFRTRNLLVTFHPVTLDRAPSTRQFAVLLEALAALGPDVGLLFTKPNADPEGRALIAMLDNFAKQHANAAAFASLGHRRYLSAMAVCDAVVGNSSSGLLEAPSLRKPAVNIGTRQAGRLRAKSVIDCAVEVGAIKRAIAKAFVMRVGTIANPYGDGHAAERIVRILKRVGDPASLLRKSFRDLEVARG
jgi:UDP-N-acetylglucosamine 2-epimerase (non-hydrolysing)/GDP/UDP-N,N'-diacetylbacillosamine 2-epimerase (hydrolysing)